MPRTSPTVRGISCSIVAIWSSGNERSSIASSNKTFLAWAEIFGDPVAAAALVDRLVHHAEIIVLKSESYSLTAKEREVMAETEGR